MTAMTDATDTAEPISANMSRAFTPAAYCWSMIFSENRYPLFGIML
jgi:hypothetical protein